MDYKAYCSHYALYFVPGSPKHTLALRSVHCVDCWSDLWDMYMHIFGEIRFSTRSFDSTYISICYWGSARILERWGNSPSLLQGFPSMRDALTSSPILFSVVSFGLGTSESEGSGKLRRQNRTVNGREGSEGTLGVITMNEKDQRSL